jgi:hypothetical protein
MLGQIKLNTGLARKFPMPQSRAEQALAMIIIGVAIFCACAIDPIRDLAANNFNQSAKAQLFKTQEFKEAGPKNNVGLYVFSDYYGSKYIVIGKKIYNEKSKVPKSIDVSWPLGSPQEARALWQFDSFSRLIFAILGLLISGFGIFQRNKAKEEK